MPSETETVKVRGLAHLFAGVMGGWGALVIAKSLYDLFSGEPEANSYSAQPWMFVTQEQWLRYGGFELAYGLACLSLAFFVLSYARFLPEIRTRPRRSPEFTLFS